MVYICALVDLSVKVKKYQKAVKCSWIVYLSRSPVGEMRTALAPALLVMSELLKYVALIVADEHMLEITPGVDATCQQVFDLGPVCWRGRGGGTDDEKVIVRSPRHAVVLEPDAGVCVPRVLVTVPRMGLW